MHHSAVPSTASKHLHRRARSCKNSMHASQKSPNTHVGTISYHSFSQGSADSAAYQGVSSGEKKEAVRSCISKDIVNERSCYGPTSPWHAMKSCSRETSHCCSEAKAICHSCCNFLPG